MNSRFQPCPKCCPSCESFLEQLMRGATLVVSGIESCCRPSGGGSIGANVGTINGSFEYPAEIGYNFYDYTVEGGVVLSYAASDCSGETIPVTDGDALRVGFQCVGGNIVVSFSNFNFGTFFIGYIPSSAVLDVFEFQNSQIVCPPTPPGHSVLGFHGTVTLTFNPA